VEHVSPIHHFWGKLAAFAEWISSIRGLGTVFYREVETSFPITIVYLGLTSQCEIIPSLL